jgi:hypothetical protein
MARRLVLTAAILAFLAGPGAGAASAACGDPGKVTAYDNPAEQDSNAGVRDDQWVAESFKVPGQTLLTKVTLYLQQFNTNTDSITVEIHADDGGEPGPLLGTGRTRTLTNTTFEFVEFDFSSDHLALAPGTTYYVVATSTAPNTDGYGWGNDSSGTYEQGGSHHTNAAHVWTTDSGSYDLLFQVFGQLCTADVVPTTPGPPALASVSGLGASPNVFAAASSGPSATLTKRRPVGTTVSYTLNEAASVKFTVKRRAKGRRVKRGKRKVCVKPTRKNRKKHRCVRYVGVRGSFSLNGAAGKNSFHFTGRLGGRKLRPGRYRLVATPTAAGKTGLPIFTGFRIVR